MQQNGNVMNKYIKKINDFEITRKTFLVEVYDLYVEEYVLIIVYQTVGCSQDGSLGLLKNIGSP